MVLAIGLPKETEASDPAFWIQIPVYATGIAALVTIFRLDWMFAVRNGFDLKRWFGYAFLKGSMDFFLRAGGGFVLVLPLMKLVGLGVSVWALPGWCLGQLGLTGGYFRVLQRMRRVRIRSELRGF